MSKINNKKLTNLRLLIIIGIIACSILFIYYLYNYTYEKFPISYTDDNDNDDDDYDNIKYSKSRYVRNNRKRSPKQYY